MGVRFIPDRLTPDRPWLFPALFLAAAPVSSLIRRIAGRDIESPANFFLPSEAPLGLTRESAVE